MIRGGSGADGDSVASGRTLDGGEKEEEVGLVESMGKWE